LEFTMTFKKGQRVEGAGRQKGSKNLKNRILQECLFMAGEALGEQGRAAAACRAQGSASGQDSAR
jgi:hypothetical protein